MLDKLVDFIMSFKSDTKKVDKLLAPVIIIHDDNLEERSPTVEEVVERMRISVDKE